MKLNKEFNIVGAIFFIALLFAGGSETGYQNIGDNIPGFILMLLGGLGLLSQFILYNISLMKK